MFRLKTHEHVIDTGEHIHVYNSEHTLTLRRTRSSTATPPRPSVGYLPGNMPWKCQETIEAAGLTVVNKKETGAATSDREVRVYKRSFPMCYPHSVLGTFVSLYNMYLLMRCM